MGVIRIATSSQNGFGVFLMTLSMKNHTQNHEYLAMFNIPKAHFKQFKKNKI